MGLPGRSDAKWPWLRSARMRSVLAMLGICAVAGCAADSPILENVLVDPGYYETMPCRELVSAYRSSESRLKELTDLMEKSGNAAINAMAYNTDYAKARTTYKYTEIAVRKKNCDLGVKVEPKKVDAMPADPARPDFGLITPSAQGNR
jgi:hypothetical protein